MPYNISGVNSSGNDEQAKVLLGGHHVEFIIEAEKDEFPSFHFQRIYITYTCYLFPMMSFRISLPADVSLIPN